MRIAFFDAKPYDLPAFQLHTEQTDLDIRFYDTHLTAQTVQLAAGCEAVCSFVNDMVDAEIIDRLCELGCRILALRCSGYNQVDLQYAAGKLRVVHVPAYSPYAVAEHTMALLLTSIRRIHKAYLRTRDFNFSLNNMTGFELHGKTMGVVGCGKIGQVLIEICKGFGMHIMAYDKYPNPDSGLPYYPLEEIWKQSDIISLHCPLTEETYHMVNAESIAQMKSGVVLLNTSRGALIDAEALLEGIKARKIGAACLDVYEEETDVFFEDWSGHIIQDDVLARLISMPNVIVTSHQAFLTQEALDSIAEITVQNLLSLQQTNTCANELYWKDGKILRGTPMQ